MAIARKIEGGTSAGQGSGGGTRSGTTARGQMATRKSSTGRTVPVKAKPAKKAATKSSNKFYQSFGRALSKAGQAEPKSLGYSANGKAFGNPRSGAAKAEAKDLNRTYNIKGRTVNKIDPKMKNKPVKVKNPLNKKGMK